MVPVPPVSFGAGGGAAAIRVQAQRSSEKGLIVATVYYPAANFVGGGCRCLPSCKRGGPEHENVI